MSSKPAALKTDETTVASLRLLRSFLKLRKARHREEIIALAEGLVKEEEKVPAEPGD